MLNEPSSLPDEGTEHSVMTSQPEECKFDLSDVISGWCIEQICRIWFIELPLRNKIEILFVFRALFTRHIDENQGERIISEMLNLFTHALKRVNNWMANTIVFFIVLHRCLFVNWNFLTALPDAFNLSPERMFSELPTNLIWRVLRLSSRVCRSMPLDLRAKWRRWPYVLLHQTDFRTSNPTLSSGKWSSFPAWEWTFIK